MLTKITGLENLSVTAKQAATSELSDVAFRDLLRCALGNTPLVWALFDGDNLKNLHPITAGSDSERIANLALSQLGLVIVEADQEAPAG